MKISVPLPRSAAQNESLPQRTGRIVGGQQASQAQFPYQVSLRSTQSGKISSHFIVSHPLITSH